MQRGAAGGASTIAVTLPAGSSTVTIPTAPTITIAAIAAIAAITTITPSTVTKNVPCSAWEHRNRCVV